MRLRRYFTPDPSRPIFVANGLNLALYFPPQGAFFMPEVLAGTYETETIRLLRALLQPGMAMVDTGAHVGYSSLMAAKHVGPFRQSFRIRAAAVTL
jgi:hypothetical protein